jgi:Ca2+-binding EF-hand superfamily protein
MLSLTNDLFFLITPLGETAMSIRLALATAIFVFVGSALVSVTAAAQSAEDQQRQPAGPPVGARSPAEMIARADKDGDGRVSRKEFLETRTAEMETMFDRVDGNGDGFLDEGEVAGIAVRMRAGAEGQRPMVERLRRPVDAPERSRVNGREEGVRPEGAPRAGEAFDRMDRDGNGSLSREEFTAGMERLREMMQRAGIGRPEGRRGSDEGFRRPPQQDGSPAGGGSQGF